MPGPASSGGCPAPPPTARVKVTARSARSELHVNVDPNRGTGYWRFDVERKRADGTWQRLKTYGTKGSRETRTINLRRGTYRVWVHPKYGYEGVLSGEVRLRK